MSKRVEMTARKHSRCNRCDEPIMPGDRITWEPGAGLAEHVDCEDVGDCDDTIEPLRWDCA